MSILKDVESKKNSGNESVEKQPKKVSPPSSIKNKPNLKVSYKKNKYALYTNSLARHVFFLSIKLILMGFGLNSSYQLGVENRKVLKAETVFVDDLDYKLIEDITCGYSCSAILTKNYQVFVAGGFFYCQTESKRFVKHKFFDGIIKVVSVRIGNNNAFYILKDGSIYAQGYNLFGALSIGNKERQEDPVLIKIEKVKNVSPGLYYTAFLTKNNEVLISGMFCDKKFLNAVKINFVDKKVLSIHSSSYGTILSTKDNDNKLRLWSVSKYAHGNMCSEYNKRTENANNELLDDGRSEFIPLPKDDDALKPKYIINIEKTFKVLKDSMLDINVGGSHGGIMAKDEDNNLVVVLYGSNSYGQLGNGTAQHQYFPIQCKLNNLGLVMVRCNMANTYVVDGKGDVYVCGNNEFGQCGMGHTATPQKDFLNIYEMDGIYENL